MTLTGDYLSIEKLPIDGGPLSGMRVADFNQDSYDDILLISGDMNILTLASGSDDGLVEPYEYFTLEDDSVRGVQVFSVLPIVVRGIYSGSVIAAGWDGYETNLFITDLGHGPEPTAPKIVGVVPPRRGPAGCFPPYSKRGNIASKNPKTLGNNGPAIA